MTRVTYSLLLFIVPFSLIAQHLNHPVMASRDDSFSGARPFVAVPETIRVLAAMAQFQTDTDPRTTGNGQLVLSAPTDSVIDAPPHNRQYFQDHLAFVENYYRKVSKGKCIVQSTVIDRVITLTGQMAVYSPPRNGSNVAVGNLVVETWNAVDSLGLVPDFSAYSCFMVFHAGAGRDIDLVATLGFDPTPSDIPSLYIGLNAFKSFYGETYQGIPVQGGNFHITNSIVAPETESRLLPGLTGDVLLELSMNGLLCASLGNFLGLPDLFNTGTGRSGIGRFGLMDGQAIFSFFGVFPPEPSAWEKYWLGWIQPITLATGEHTVEMPAVSLADSVYRIPISAHEYFLLENRNRDPQRNGQTVTSVFNGQTSVRVFPKDTAGFESFDIEALSGVVTDVEDFDWSLPGGRTSSDEFFDGGALLWHIDESIIQQELSSNSINADPLRRGVDVEEADGSQDIGQEYGFLTPGSGSEDGTALDFWFETNSAPVFTNEFSVGSHPNSMSNTAAQSHVKVHGFSPRGPRMTATVTIGDDVIAPLASFPKRVTERLTSQALTAGDLNSDATSDLVISTTSQLLPSETLSPDSVIQFVGQAKLYAWSVSGSTPPIPGTFSSGLIAIAGQTVSDFVAGPVILDLNRDGAQDLVVGRNVGNAIIQDFATTDAGSDSLADQLFAANAPTKLITPQVADDSLLVGGGEGAMLIILNRADATVRTLRVFDDSLEAVVGVSRNSGRGGFVCTGNAGSIAITDSNAGAVVSLRSLQSAIAGPVVVGLVGSSGEPRIAAATVDGRLFLLDARLNLLPGFPHVLSGSVSKSPALADIDQDGFREVIVFSGNKINVCNHAGASLDNFPITLATTQPITSHPIVADVNGDGAVEIVAVSSDGFVAAYDRSGRMAPGFPLQAGVGEQSVAVFDVPTPSLTTVDVGLAVASSESGSLVSWKTGSTRIPYEVATVRPWPQYQKDASHSGLSMEPLTGTPLSSAFFPEERAYNWPNPVYDGKTFIRYFIKDDATVNIKIFDLAGGLVDELAASGIGGVDNEVAWDVLDVQSGVYFARIEAQGSGGSGVAIVKIAVVK